MKTAGPLRNGSLISRTSPLATTCGAVVVVEQQLVPRGAIDALQTLCGFVRPSQVPDRNPVDIELLMADLHWFFDYDNDDDNS